MTETPKKRKLSDCSTQLEENTTSSPPQANNSNKELTPTKRKRYTFEEKKKILEEFKFLNFRQVCAKYGLHKSVLCKWRSCEEMIKNAAKTSHIKTLKKVSEPNVLDAELVTWVYDCRREGISITGPMLCRQALVINCRIGGPESFKASHGWLEGWKRRTRIKHFNVTDVPEDNSTEDAIPSCNLLPASSETEAGTTNETNEDPMENMRNVTNILDCVVTCGGSRMTEFRLEEAADSREPHSWDILNDDDPGSNERMIKEEPQEPCFVAIKSEPTDEETTEFCGYPDRTVAETIDIKNEAADLADGDSSSHSQHLGQTSTIVIDESSRTSANLENVEIHIDKQIGGSKFTDIIGSDRDLKVLTGIPNFQVLRKIRDIMTIARPRLITTKGLKLNIEDRIIMTFMKLKQNLSFSALSIIFKCRTIKSCKRIIIQTLDSLSETLKFAIRWPTCEKNVVLQTSKEHSFDFANLRCIINRLEIVCQRPKEIHGLTSSYSRDKGCHTVKFMTAITPSGFICFVSKAWGGRISDRIIFQKSHIVESLNKNDGIMLFKDFPVDDICRDNNIGLMRSLYSRQTDSGPQNCRIMLNVNRKIRRYKIFRGKLTNPFVLRAEGIVTILCATENLNLLSCGISNFHGS